MPEHGRNYPDKARDPARQVHKDAVGVDTSAMSDSDRAAVEAVFARKRWRDQNAPPPVRSIYR